MKTNRGLTLVELLVYAGAMAVLLGATAVSLSFTYGLYRDFTIGPRVDRVGIAITERITRDIRTGATIDLANSSFGVPAGTLTINAIENEIEVAKYFAVQNARLMYREDAGSLVPLTPDDMTVSRFLLTHLTTPLSEAVRFELEITFTNDDGVETRTFTGLAILRQSYE